MSKKIERIIIASQLHSIDTAQGVVEFNIIEVGKKINEICDWINSQGEEREVFGCCGKCSRGYGCGNPMCDCHIVKCHQNVTDKPQEEECNCFSSEKCIRVKCDCKCHKPQAQEWTKEVDRVIDDEADRQIIKELIVDVLTSQKEEWVRNYLKTLPLYTGGILDEETEEYRKGRNEVLKEIRESLALSKE